MSNKRDMHLFSAGPKRILALDGGGIRGISSVQILRRIEEFVRERSANPAATLSGYFDLIGGTSTGTLSQPGLPWAEKSTSWTACIELLEKLYSNTSFSAGACSSPNSMPMS